MILDTVTRGIRNTSYRNPEKWFLDWFHGGQESDSGVNVGPHSALKYAPWFQGINMISGDIGKIPLPLYKRTPEGRERDRKHHAYRLTMHEFNEAMTADVGKQLLQSHALGWGNGRGAILRDNAENPLAIVPLLPDRTETKVVSGEVWHITKIGDSQEDRAYRDENVLHIKGLGFDGITGYSVATMARNSLGLGLASEKHGSFLFKNGALPGIVLEAEGRVSPADAKQLIADWDKWHAGIGNTGRTGLTHMGIKAKPLMGMSSDDAQWIETRKFQRGEVASFLNLPPHKLGDTEKAGYNGLYEENQSYLNGCLLFWFVRWQQECRRKLLREREKETDSHYFEFLPDILASVDFAAKVEGLTKLVAGTIFSPNEAREKLNMNHREGGDKYENPNTSGGERPPVAGPPGPPGENGKDGKDGRGGRRASVNDRGELVFEWTDGITDTLGRVVGNNGKDGEPGINGQNGRDGINGIDGRDGKDGRGISNLRLIGESLAVTYTDDSESVLGPAIGPPGPQGIAGERGPAGIDGERGPKGDVGEPSLYGRCLDVLSAAVEKESSIVRHHAANAKNFTRWHETWYPKWQAKFAADLKRLGADEVLAAEHCQESERQIDELAGKVTTQEELVAQVETLTAAWAERAVVLARRIAASELPNSALSLETLVSTPHGLGKIVGIESGWRYEVELQDGTKQIVNSESLEVLG